MQHVTFGSETAQESLLDIQGLTLSLRDEEGWVQVLNNVSLSVKPREIVGVVGESGCGKSMTALSVLRLVPPRTSKLGGKIMFGSTDLVAASEAEMMRIRGRHISMIFQEPMSALDPVFTVGHQIAETVRRHFKISRRESRRTRGRGARCRGHRISPACGDFISHEPFRRHAPTCDDRHGPGLRAQAAHCR